MIKINLQNSFYMYDISESMIFYRHIYIDMNTKKKWSDNRQQGI